MRKFISYFTFLTIASLMALSCNNTANEVAVESVTISAPQDTLLVGETMELSVEVLPTEATNKEFSLSVNEDGKSCIEIVDQTHIRGIKAGTAHITATAADNGKSASVKVVVKKDPNSEEPGPDEPVVPTPQEQIFEFDIEVDGIDVDIDITTDVDSTYYVTYINSHYLSADGEVTINLNTYVTSQILELTGAGMTFDEILRTGNSEYNFSHNDAQPLLNNESYTVYAVVVRGTEKDFSLGTGNTAEFRTESRGSYEGEENILTMEATSTDNTITVNVGATTDEAYYIACMKEREYNSAFAVSMPTEIMGYFYFHYENGTETYDAVVKKENGSKEITFDNLASGTQYIIIAFGYAYNEEFNKPTTELYSTSISTTGTPQTDGGEEQEDKHVVFTGTSASIEVGAIYGQPCTDGSRYTMTINTDDENTYLVLDLWPAVKFDITGSYDETRGTENGIGQLGGAESRYYYVHDGSNTNLPIEGQCEISDNGDGTFTVAGQGVFQYQLESIEFSYTGVIEGWEN